MDMVEYNYAVAERQKTKLLVESWVRKFRDQYKKNPTDADTGPIAIQLSDFEHAEKHYLNLKLKMMEANLLPFDVKEFTTNQAASSETPGQ